MLFCCNAYLNVYADVVILRLWIEKGQYLHKWEQVSRENLFMIYHLFFFFFFFLGVSLCLAIVLTASF